MNEKLMTTFKKKINMVHYVCCAKKRNESWLVSLLEHLNFYVDAKRTYKTKDRVTRTPLKTGFKKLR
jgi:GT2 family glycosyltransferase